jgi:hypothetical protein
MQPPDPVFANHFSIGFNDEEFLIQFGLMYEGQPAPTVVFTAITTPGYARRLRDLLSESLVRYDSEPLPPGSVTQ